MNVPFLRQRAVTMVELMVALTIIIFIVGITTTSMAPVIRKTELLNHLKYVKSSFSRARGKAIEFTAPVRFSVGNDNSILIVRDDTRDGNWDDAKVILGRSTTVGSPSPYGQIQFLPAGGPVDLPHWTGLASTGNVGLFTNSQCVIMPDGQVLSGNSLASASGTFFFQTSRQDYFGAVHITSLGEIKMAYYIPDNPADTFNGWRWTE